MAILDCMGKYFNTPLYNLIGGKCRDKASFVAYEYSNDPEKSLIDSEIPSYMATKLLEARNSTGSNFVEFKVGTNSIMTDTFSTFPSRAFPLFTFPPFFTFFHLFKVFRRNIA